MTLATETQAGRPVGLKQYEGVTIFDAAIMFRGYTFFAENLFPVDSRNRTLGFNKSCVLLAAANIGRNEPLESTLSFFYYSFLTKDEKRLVSYEAAASRFLSTSQEKLPERTRAQIAAALIDLTESTVRMQFVEHLMRPATLINMGPSHGEGYASTQSILDKVVSDVVNGQEAGGVELTAHEFSKRLALEADTQRLGRATKDDLTEIIISLEGVRSAGAESPREKALAGLSNFIGKYDLSFKVGESDCQKVVTVGQLLCGGDLDKLVVREGEGGLELRIPKQLVEIKQRLSNNHYLGLKSLPPSEPLLKEAPRPISRKFIPARLLQVAVKYLEGREKAMRRQEVFSAMYARNKNHRANHGHQFFSGRGSHDKGLVQPYVAETLKFLKSFAQKPDVVDLGCGDFNIGRQLRGACGTYVACDIVPELIDANKQTYATVGVDFRTLDICKDELPKGKVAILRQVLQHLSNSDISAILPKLGDFEYLVLTEELATGEFRANQDKLTGRATRRETRESGVVIKKAPFSWQPLEESIICQTPSRGGILRTTVYRLQ